MKILFQTLRYLTLALWTCTACTRAEPVDLTADADTVAELKRGEIEKDRFVASFTLADIQDKLAETSEALVGMARYPVEIHRLTYMTVAPDGTATTASGTLAFPKGLSRALPLVSYQHGTAVHDHYSEMSSEVELVPLIFASSGYIAIVPDYLGLEDSPGLHPYIHADSLASAVVDMLRASRSYCEDERVRWNKKLFLMGYSEGGYATMAAHRAIEHDHTDEFSVTASAPMAGPYDLSGTMAKLFLKPTSNPNPYYLAYTLLAYNDVYHFSPSLDALFTAEYAERLPLLFDGLHTGKEINSALPKVPRHMLNPDFVAAIETRPDHPFLEALAENDVYRWIPLSPMRLYHCDHDNVVPLENSAIAYDYFTEQGAAHVELEVMEGDDHLQCAAPSIMRGKAWFDSL